MITVDNLCVSYDGRPVLRDLSFSVAPGEHVALMGPSGCGKSTLAHALLGLLAPDAGTIRVEGTVACVFQDLRLLPWCTALENIRAVLLRGESQWAALCLERVGLAQAANRYPAELSGGMLQRLALARALAVRADILLLDEPFRALDETTRAHMLSLVKEAAAEQTLLLITHAPEEAEALTHRTIRVNGDSSR